MHHRHLRPWELFPSDDESDASTINLNSKSPLPFETNKSWESEPWVAKYEKRNVLRKVLDREVWVQEPALRQIQDTIFIQGILFAFLASAVMVGIFVAIPRGNKF